MDRTEKSSDQSLPTLTVLVQAADAGLHPWVLDHVATPVRRAALEEELGFTLNTAARDMEYATTFAKDAPQSGQPARAYLDRWVALGAGDHVMVGPRYLGRDPNLPFVVASASDRPLTPADRGRLVAVAGESFGAFRPGFVLLTTADPTGAWPDTRPELRQLVALLGDLRRRQCPTELSLRPRHDTDFYDRYRRIYELDVARDSSHARHTQLKARADLQELASRELLFDVQVNGAWAGIVAAAPDARRGIRGATVIELLLDHGCRGLGYGRHLSTLLAKALPLPDEECLMGTIHADNIRAYRSALGAGRVDVGGEILIPL